MHDECLLAFPITLIALLFPCNTVNANQGTKNRVGLGTMLPWIDVFYTAHTHTCVQEEHVRVGLKREASRKTCFITEEVRVLKTQLKVDKHTPTPP